MTFPRTPFTAFYHHSSTKPEGWYFVDDMQVWSGPYTTLIDCWHFMEEAKKEFPRS